MELRPGYREWAPPAALRPAVSCLWTSVAGSGEPTLVLPLTELRDQRVDLAEVAPELARRLPGDLAPGVALRRLIDMTTRLASEHPPDRLVSRAARLLAGPGQRTGELARDLGVSERQFRRRCLDAVGYGPKTLDRVLRFRRFVSRIDAAAGRPDLSRIAADAGYADQAHLTRERVRLAGLPPAALVRTRRG